MTRLERLEKASPVIDEANRLDRIILKGIGTSIECVLWTRPGFVEAENDP